MAFLSGDSGGKLISNFIQIVGQFWFHVAMGLRSPFLCDGGLRLLVAAHVL